MSDRFALATSVVAIDGPDPDVGDDSRRRWSAAVHDGWDIGGNANGGYLLAIAGRAMAESVGAPPLTLTGHYLRPAPAGPCEVATTVVRSGRRLSTVAATLSMGGEATLQLLGTFGEQRPGGPSRTTLEPVELAPFEECVVPPPPTDGLVPELMNRIDLRMRPEDAGFRVGRPTGRPEVSGWFALGDGEEPDEIALLLAADAFAPPVFNTDLPVGWVPTVELTVHVLGVPAPGPLRCSFRSSIIEDGLMEEDGVMWDSAGSLVGTSRQLALMPR
ncbi:thioesterase family protein [Ilumatobacter sp.]|uniref:thioesterase family protein n=1 Tax=Ilumatobacter sp. TaxID=1967498 RepID=UPI003B51605A